MKIRYRIISAAMAVGMAASVSTNAFAAKKEEVVYVMAGADGSVKNVYAVNSFEGGKITDYGGYSSVKLLNIDGNITHSGDEVTFSSPENKKVYYQGTLKSNDIPWNISIRYFLDGEELSAKDIAGKSGALEIRIDISENESCGGDFYKDYALQCSFTLNTENCSDIRAEGATVANVGKKKQITYTVLPGRGLSKSIFADVTDFEMDEGSINGIKMNLGIDIDDDNLREKLNDLIDGSEELDDGANELHDGTVDLNDGVSDLNDGIQKLRDGISEAQDGVSELTSRSPDLVDGSADVRKALGKIQSVLSDVSASTDELEQLVSASSQIKAAIEQLCGGISSLKDNVNFDAYKSAMKTGGLDIDVLKSGNEQAISQLTEQLTELKSTLAHIGNFPQYAEQAARLKAQIAQLETIVQLLTGNNALIEGSEVYLNEAANGISELDAGAAALKTKYDEFDNAINQMTAQLSGVTASLTELKNGINTLTEEYAKLDDGISEYTDGVKKLSDGLADLADGAKELADGGSDLAKGAKKLMDGASELKNGTGELRCETDKIDSTFSADFDDLSDILDSLSGDDKTVTSFLSDKNTSVSSVQFVIKTDAVEIPKPTEEETEPEPELNFWQKLLKLFGIE